MNTEAAKVPLSVRSPFIESKCIIQYKKGVREMPSDVNDERIKVFEDPIAYLENIKGRRIIKSHLPLEFLPPKVLDTCKVLYVARNPKDVVVSFHHHNRILPNHGFIGSFEQFLEMFEDDLHVYGSYWHHLRGGWQQREHKNMKVLWFENMKTDQKAVIKELCDFLQHPLSEDKVDRLCDHVKFENMRQNPYVNPSAAKEIQGEDKNFMRKGQVGDWRNYFDDERNQKWTRWIAENTRGTGLEAVSHIQQIL